MFWVKYKPVPFLARTYCQQTLRRLGLSLFWTESKRDVDLGVILELKKECCDVSWCLLVASNTKWTRWLTSLRYEGHCSSGPHGQRNLWEVSLLLLPEKKEKLHVNTQGYPFACLHMTHHPSLQTHAHTIHGAEAALMGSTEQFPAFSFSPYKSASN